MAVAGAGLFRYRPSRQREGMNQRRLYSFPGGIRLDPRKDEASNTASQRLPVPEKLILPLQQHVGIAAQPCVEVGQEVLKGELIADTGSYVGMRVHAPTSGVISAIDQFPVIHPSGLRATCIELAVDDKDAALESCEFDDPAALEPHAIYERIVRAGIVGLGGAGFPTHVKIREGAGQRVDTLIINGVECEPYITCDDRLIREHPAEVLAGAALVARAIDAGECIVAVEDDMPGALTALRGAEHEAIELVSVPAVYPAGGEKQLITVLTGREVPSGLLPIHIGIVVLNVATVVAVYRAVTKGQPLIERMVTVAGVPAGANVEVLIGTPVRHLLEHCGLTDWTGHQILSGGPMMGTEILDPCAPITKTVNCILVLRRDRVISPTACIRCGDCVPVCPVGLQPQQMFEAARISDFDAAQDLHLFDCIDCGCCAYVCPSRLPLVQYFRYAKSSIEALDRDRTEADSARARYDAHKRRGFDDRAGAALRVELADVDAMDTAALQREVQAAVARVGLRRK